MIALDYAISGYVPGRKGGMPHGKVIELWGKESSCKSTVLQYIMKGYTDRGGACLVADVEESHDAAILEFRGVDTDALRFIEKPVKEDKDGHVIYEPDYSLQEFMDLSLEGLGKIRALSKDAPLMLALDSLAMIDTEEQEEAKSSGKENMRTSVNKATVLSRHLGRFCKSIRRYEAGFVVVNQIRQKPGAMFEDPDYSTGGNAKNHVFSLRVKLKGGNRIKPDEDPFVSKVNKGDKAVGISTRFEIVKNKLAPPYAAGRGFLFFDERGFCPYFNFVKMIVEDRALHEENTPFKKSGISFEWKGTPIGKGIKQLARNLKDDPDLMEEMEHELFIEPKGVDVLAEQQMADEEVGQDEEEVVEAPKKRRGRPKKKA
jgi:recombination protein RecA